MLFLVKVVFSTIYSTRFGYFKPVMTQVYCFSVSYSKLKVFSQFSIRTFKGCFLYSKASMKLPTYVHLHLSPRLYCVYFDLLRDLIIVQDGKWITLQSNEIQGMYYDPTITGHENLEWYKVYKLYKLTSHTELFSKLCNFTRVKTKLYK